MLRVRRRIAYRRESKIVARPLLFHVRNADAAELFPSNGIDSSRSWLAYSPSENRQCLLRAAKGDFRGLLSTDRHHADGAVSPDGAIDGRFSRLDSALAQILDLDQEGSGMLAVSGAAHRLA